MFTGKREGEGKNKKRGERRGEKKEIKKWKAERERRKKGSVFTGGRWNIMERGRENIKHRIMQRKSERLKGGRKNR